MERGRERERDGWHQREVKIKKLFYIRRDDVLSRRTKRERI